MAPSPRAEEAAVAAWKAAARAPIASATAGAATTSATRPATCATSATRWGDQFELMLPLDADSLMSGAEIVRLVRMMQAHPKIGILQSLVVGMPSASAFARIFQFGMRHGMRAYTMGQAWWVGDCGPFGAQCAGARAAVLCRVRPAPLCSAPPLGGHVLSHDQVEATLMRRAGYEVRVLPEEVGSWEENPPTMLEFARRDVRWCQGNMQYLKLPRPAGPLSDEPVSVAAGDFDVRWHSGLDADDRPLPVAAWQAQSVPEFPTGAAKALYVTYFIVVP